MEHERRASQPDIRADPGVELGDGLLCSARPHHSGLQRCDRIDRQEASEPYKRGQVERRVKDCEPARSISAAGHLGNKRRRPIDPICESLPRSRH